MNKVIGRRFSRFLVWALVLFEAISLAIVVGILYGILSRTMTREFYNKLEVHESEISMTLHDRLNMLETKLREISSKNAIRVSLMLEMEGQTLELMEENYPFSNGTFFFVQEEKSSTFIPELPERFSILQTHLSKLRKEDQLQSIEFQNYGEGVYLSFFSIPITKKNSRLGTAYALYDLSQDERFWQRMDTKPDAMLLIQDNGHLVDLRTGRSRAFPKGTGDHLAKGLPYFCEDIIPDKYLIPLKRNPGVFYATSSIPLQKQKASLILILGCLCVAIFLLTLLVSLVIARKVSEPLESMADQALRIAQEPSGASLREEEIQYVEFRKLARAFNHVLTNFLEAQADLKRRAEEVRKLNEGLEERVVERTTELARMNEELQCEIVGRKQAEEELHEHAKQLESAKEYAERNAVELTKAFKKLKTAQKDLKYFNNAAVGREMRIIEVKREVNALLKQLDREPKYIVTDAQAKV